MTCRRAASGAGPGGTVLLTTLLGALLVIGGCADAAASTATETPHDEDGEADWHRLVERMAEAASELSFEGELVVVTFSPHGPNIAAMAVRQGPEGTVVSAGPRPWVVPRREGMSAGDGEAGALLRLGRERTDVFSAALLERNYSGEVAGRAEGPDDREAIVVELRPRGGEAVRERLHVDRSTGLVLRRETFQDDGEPVRVVAFTALETDVEVGAAAADEEAADDDRSMVAARMSERGLGILRETGWTAPSELAGGFVLREAFAVGEAEHSSLHLVYSDGLYALSVYGEEGRMDADSVSERGAERTHLGDMSVHRWPAAEPAAYVWSGPERTYTAVSDAPSDHLADALAVFPHERERPLLGRLRRGMERAFDRLWPFG